MTSDKWISFLDIKNHYDTIGSNDAAHIVLDDELQDDDLIKVVQYFRSIYWNLGDLL